MHPPQSKAQHGGDSCRRLTKATGAGATTTGLGEGLGEGGSDGLGEGGGLGDGLGEGDGLGDGEGLGLGLGSCGTSGEGVGSAGGGDGWLPLPAGTSTAVAGAVDGSLLVDGSLGVSVGSPGFLAAKAEATRSSSSSRSAPGSQGPGLAATGGGRRRPRRPAGGLSAIAGRFISS